MPNSEDFRDEHREKMATSMEPYDKWLEEKLLSLNPDVDTDVFVSYIRGILDEDSPDDEKMESISDILETVLDESCDKESVCIEVVKKWEELSGQNTNQSASSTVELASQFADMLQTQNIETVKTHTKTKEERDRKAAILAQYANVSDEEEDDRPVDPGGAKTVAKTTAAGEGGGGRSAGGDPLDLLQKNINALSVVQNEQEKRDKSKLEAEKKKEKDKVDRQTQKQKQQDRKEAEKKRTAKGERRTR